MEANEAKTTNACEELLSNPDLTMEELKEAYRQLDDTCEKIDEDYDRVAESFNKSENECAALRAELKSLKEKYSLYDYYREKTILLDSQVEALKKAVSALSAYISAQA